jgi:hypothetical protein
LTSGDKIRYFLEEEAVDKDGKLMRPKEKAVNKIGHGTFSAHLLCEHICHAVRPGLHELDPVYRKVTLENPAIKAVARDMKFHRDPVGASTAWPEGRIILKYGTSSSAIYDYLQATAHRRRRRVLLTYKMAERPN